MSRDGPLPGGTGAPPAPVSANGDWRPLPPRARWLFVLGNLAATGGLALALLVPIGLGLGGTPLALPLAVAVLVALPGGDCTALRQYAPRWRLDAHGYALRRARLWRRGDLRAAQPGAAPGPAARADRAPARPVHAGAAPPAPATTR